MIPFKLKFGGENGRLAMLLAIAVRLLLCLAYLWSSSVGPSFLAVAGDGPKRVSETGGNVVCRLCAELTDTPRVLVPGDLSKSDVASLAWCSTGRSVIFR